MTPEGDFNSSLSSSSSDSTIELASPPSYLAPAEDDYQLCLFMSTWVSFPHDAQGDRGFLELLPSMYSFAKLDSPLTLCVSAISGALSAKFILKMKDVEMPNVRRKYAKALSATRRALQDPVESVTDQTLMATCLLGYYDEVVASFQGRISSPRHFEGAAALINQRQGKLSTSLAQRLLLGVRNNILQRALVNSTPIDTTSSIWQDSGSIPHNAATLLDQMSTEIPNLLVAGSQYIQGNQTPRKSQTLPRSSNLARADIITKALAIDAELSQWPASTPLSWTPVRLSTKAIPKPIIAMGGLYADHCDVYPDIVVCSTWNSYRSSRLKVLSLIAQLSPPTFPTSPTSHLQSTAVEKIQALADDICASVPYCLGDKTGPIPLYSTEISFPVAEGKVVSADQHRTANASGGWFLFSPMKEVMGVGRWLRPGQMAWVGGGLMRLARGYDVEPADD